MKYKRLLILLSLVLFPAILFAKASPNDVIARVNGKPIYYAELDQKFKQSKLVLTTHKVTKQRLLNQIINRVLGIDRAYKAKLHKDGLVRQKMEDVLYHAQVSKDLEPELKKITVNDGEVEKYYKKNAEYRTAHILIKVPTVGGDAVFTKAKKQIDKIYSKVRKSPKKFSQLANKFTQGSTAPNGGDIGYQPKVRLDPNYYNAISGKQKGFISKPVKSQFGWHIIKVLGTKGYKNINMDFYKKLLYDQKRDKIIENYYADLRNGATIKIEKKYLK
ncbi:MAG: hypothetical protein HOE90_11755 [Bacteriovoracaceae bacterium]|jgi:parvulin-like peptidyl-prolyl isomerase|nr:hypothetical protein [Bacteriovoracaceae bacterium]